MVAGIRKQYGLIFLVFQITMIPFGHRKIPCIYRTVPRTRNQLAHTRPSLPVASPSSCIKTLHRDAASYPLRDRGVVSCLSTFDVAPRSFAHCSLRASDAMQHSALASICSVQPNDPFLLFSTRCNSEQRCFDDSYRYLFST